MIQAWLELARLTNAPTVVTNALLGAAVAMAWCASIDAAPVAGRDIAILVAALVSTYTAGMIMNDWFDLAIDRVERPGRPLPSGRISSTAALNVAIILMGLGMILPCAVAPRMLVWVLLLGSAVVAYNRLHAWAFLAIPLLALCRMLAVTIPALALTPADQPPWPLLGCFIIPLGVFIALVTLIARREVGAPGARRWLGVLLPIAALAPLASIASGLLPRLTEGRLLGLGFITGALIAWLIRAQLFATPLPRRMVAPLLPGRLKPGGVRMPRAVMAWIGAIALMDAMGLLLLGEPGLAVAAIGLFFLTTVGHARIAGS
ncbi:MAG: UbiA family prenyltransferase [Phycisphaeraceae bacterium]|nr:UbiA family prenyltransferase [Phycisphaeraceae bacterium]